MAAGRGTLMVNAATNYVRVGAAFLVSLLLIPYILGTLGQEAFGLWSLIFSVLGFFALMDFGFATAIVKYVAECRGANAMHRRNQIVSTVFLLYLGLAALSALAIGILSLGFNHLLDIPDSQQSYAVAVLWILSLRAVILNLPLSLFRGILFGEKKIYLINLISAASTVLYGLLAWWVLSQGHGIIALAWCNLVAMILEHLCYVLLSLTLVPDLRIRWSFFSWPIFKEVASFSGYQLMTDLASLALLQMDLILVQYFHDLHSVAVYAIALRISTHVFYLSKQFVNVLSPLFAEANGQGDKSKIRKLLITGTRLALAPGVVFFLSALVFAPDAIKFWVGEGFELSAEVIVLLLAAVLLGLPYLVSANVLAMTGHHRFTSWAAVASMCVNAFCSIMLVKPLGLVGIAWGTVIARVVVDLLFVLKRACSTYGVTVWSYFLLGIVPSVMPGVFQYAVLMAFRDALPPENLGWLLVDCLLGAGVYAAIFWRYCLEPETKSLLRSL